MDKNKYYQFIEKDEDISELYIYGDIVSSKWLETDVTSNDIKDIIKNLKSKELNVHINSYGGEVFEGIAIYNLLKQSPVKVNVYVDSCACSIASVIAMAGDKVYMPENTLMMIHNCWSLALGNSNELRKQADDLDKIMESSIASYMSRITITEEELKELLNNETWLTAKECVEMGFADELLPINEEAGVYQSTALFNLIKKTKEQVMPAEIEIKEEEIVFPTTDEIEEEITEEETIENSNEEIEEKKPEQKETFRESFLNEIKNRKKEGI